MIVFLILQFAICTAWRSVHAGDTSSQIRIMRNWTGINAYLDRRLAQLNM